MRSQIERDLGRRPSERRILRCGFAGAIELLRADVRDFHDRVSLLRAKLYRWGLGPNAQLQKLEGELEHAEQ
jgi:hypothetical protein